MKKLLGSVIGTGLIGMSLLLLIGTVAAFSKGDMPLKDALLMSLLLIASIALGVWIFRSARRPAAVLILTEEGKLVELPSSMVPGNLQPGSLVHLGDMRGAETLPTGDAKRALTRADTALSAGSYEQAFSLYEQALREHPTAAPLAYANMGVCCFFFRQYGRAIEHYDLAKRHGANAWAMDENIEEARQAMATAVR
ncbi:MAG: hypothetical protein ACMG6S_03870 [Byssovorax sp.]